MNRIYLDENVISDESILFLINITRKFSVESLANWEYNGR